jgi:thymidylate kinase
LNYVIKNFTYLPYTILLNPPLELIKSRLAKRRGAETRTNRDKIFDREDSDMFLINLRNYFENFKTESNILYIEDNGKEEIKKIISWVENIK